jgi:hypothetical protein
MTNSEALAVLDGWGKHHLGENARILQILTSLKAQQAEGVALLPHIQEAYEVALAGFRELLAPKFKVVTINPVK